MSFYLGWVNDKGFRQCEWTRYGSDREDYLHIVLTFSFPVKCSVMLLIYKAGIAGVFSGMSFANRWNVNVPIFPLRVWLGLGLNSRPANVTVTLEKSTLLAESRRG